MTDQNPTSPVDVSEDRTWFDRAADTTSHIIAKPAFFVVCLAVMLVWVVSGPVLEFSHGWVDTLEVVVALITFMIVALLQNEGWRGAKATQRKLNAIAGALAELMEQSDVDKEHVHQLHAAVGLEKRESSTR